MSQGPATDHEVTYLRPVTSTSNFFPVWYNTTGIYTSSTIIVGDCACTSTVCCFSKVA